MSQLEYQLGAAVACFGSLVRRCVHHANCLIKEYCYQCFAETGRNFLHACEIFRARIACVFRYLLLHILHDYYSLYVLIMICNPLVVFLYCVVC